MIVAFISVSPFLWKSSLNGEFALMCSITNSRKITALRLKGRFAASWKDRWEWRDLKGLRSLCLEDCIQESNYVWLGLTCLFFKTQSYCFICHHFPSLIYTVHAECREFICFVRSLILKSLYSVRWILIDLVDYFNTIFLGLFSVYKLSRHRTLHIFKVQSNYYFAACFLNMLPT